MKICKWVFGYEYKNSVEETNFSYFKSEKDRKFIQAMIRGNETEKVLENLVDNLSSTNKFVGAF